MVLEDRFTTEGLIIIALAIVPTALLALGELWQRRPLTMAFAGQPYGPQGTVGAQREGIVVDLAGRSGRRLIGISELD